MQFSREIDPFSHSIRSYGPGEVTVILPHEPAELQDDLLPPSHRHETLNHSLIITPGRLIRDWPPQQFEELEQGHFDVFAELQPEILLFGTGPQLRWPEYAMTSPLLNRGIGVEVMDTAAACRTYNILMADERNVAAALLMI